MGDPAVTSALAAAARRGVQVTITMTADSEWDDAFSQLARAGARIRLYPDDSSALYIHAKAIVADAGRPGQQVLVGSQNFSVASLGYNRELGIRTRYRPAVAAIAAPWPAISPGPEPYATARRPAARRLRRAGGPGARVPGHGARLNAAAREQRLRALQPAAPEGHRARRRPLGQLRDQRLGLRGDLPERPPAGARITVTVGGATCTTRELRRRAALTGLPGPG